MHVSREQRLPSGAREREFVVNDTPGVLWLPEARSAPVPLVLLGHPGGLSPMHPRLVARAERCAQDGFASATIELPEAATGLRRTTSSGLAASCAARWLVLPLLERAVPEWQATLDALLSLPGIGGPVGYSGGVIAIGTRLARVEPRVVAAVLLAGSFVPRSTYEEARQVTTPLHVAAVGRRVGRPAGRADLFDAFGSSEKSLHVHLGRHTGVPESAGEDAARFLARHLGRRSDHGSAGADGGHAG